MQGDKKVIQELNKNLSAELTAILQYVVHSSMCGNWKYKKLSKLFIKRAQDEMGHADALIDRILFLEGIPIVTNLGDIKIGKTVEEMHRFDHEAEIVAIDGYNKSIKVAEECKDNGTRKLFESHLEKEEEHIDIIEANQDQIQQIGTPNYLVEQI